MRIAPGQPDRKVRGHAIIDAKGQPSRGEIIPRHYTGVIDARKLTKPRHEHAPAVLRRGLHHRRAALAFWAGRSRKPHTEVMPSRIDRKTCGTKAGAAHTNIVHAPRQIGGLNI